MPIFCFKSVKIYTGQKNLHWRRQWRQWQLWGMHPFFDNRFSFCSFCSLLVSIQNSLSSPGFVLFQESCPLFWSQNIWPLPFLIWSYLPPWFWPNEGAVGVWGSFWSTDIYPSLVLFWVWGGSGIRGGYEDVSHSLALIKKYWPFPLFWSQIDLRMREQWGFEEDMKEALWNSKVFQCDDDNDRKRDNHQNNYALWNWKQFKRIIMMIVIIAMKTMLSGTWRHFKRNLGDSRTWRSIRSIHC